MGNLTKCLKASKLSAEDKNELKSAAKSYQEEDMTRAEAVEAAIADAIEETLSARKRVSDYVETRGGVLPTEPKDPDVVEPKPQPVEPKTKPAAEKPKEKAAPKELKPSEYVDEVLNKNKTLILKGKWRIKRAPVGDTSRLQVTGVSKNDRNTLKKMGADVEIINYKSQVFISAEKANEIVSKILSKVPVVDVVESKDTTFIGPGSRQAGAINIGAAMPKAHIPSSYKIVTGFRKSGQPIIERTSHPSVRERNAFVNFWKRNFTKEGNLPDEIFDQKIEMEGVKADIDVHQEFIVHNFKKAVEKHKGIPYTQLSSSERQLLNDALAGEKSAYDSLAKDIQEAIDVMRGHLSQQSMELIRTLHELIAVRMESLDEKTKQATNEAINDIFSGKEVEEIDVSKANQGIVRKAWLVMTIQGNLDSYLNRAYEAFDNPKWKKKILKNDKVIDDVRAYLTERAKLAEQNRLTKEAKAQVEAMMPWQDIVKGPGSLESKAKARQQMVDAKLEELYDTEGLTPGDIDELVEGQINNILDAAEKKHDLIGFMSSEKLGQKDLGTLKRRKEIAEPIRKLLGEYKDPVFNYTRSSSKTGFIVANHDFLMNARKLGLDSFLSLNPIGRFSTEITARDPETMTPLTGLYSTKEFAQSLEDAIDPKVIGALYKSWLQINGLVKYGKTVLSPITMMRNFWSASFFTFMNGHFNWNHLGKSYHVVLADLAKKGDLATWEKYIRKMIRLGVLHSGVRSEEIWQAANDAINMDRQFSKPIEALKTGVIKIPTALYRAGDDVWKIVGFENELAALMKRDGITKDEAEKIAAERIRNGYPTYSHVPRAIQWLRRMPLLGPFVSFPWEIIRTSGHQLRFLIEDAKAGQNLSVARRAVGMLMVGATAGMVSQMAMTLAGVDKEEDEAIRAVGPRWQRNANLVYFRTADGKLWSWDFSHLDPYTYLKTPVMAILNGNNDTAWKKLSDGVIQLTEPFLGVEITTGAMTEVLMNKRLDTGGRVYNEQEPNDKKALTVLDHLRRRLQPGIASQLENLHKAYKGEVSRGGKQYTLSGEMATFAGFRFTPINAPIALKYRAVEFKNAKGSANTLLAYPLTDPNELKKRDIDDAYDSMIKAHTKLHKDMNKAWKAAGSMGMNKIQMRRVLKAAGVSKRDIVYISQGKIPPWVPSQQFLQKAQAMALATALTADDRVEVIKRFRERHLAVRKRAAEEMRKAD